MRDRAHRRRAANLPPVLAVRPWRLAACLVLGIGLCAPLRAHQGSESHLVLTVEAQQIQGEWEIALHDLAPLFDPAVAPADAEAARALVAAHSELESYALGRLRLLADARPCDLRPGRREAAVRARGLVLLLHFAAHCDHTPRALTVDYRLLFETDPRHRGLLKLQAGELIRPAVFTAESNEQTFTLHNPGPLERAAGDIRSGVWHIWTGFDHLLFLLCLLLPSLLAQGVARPGQRARRSFAGDVLRIVTAFTVAHSITLGLAALQILSLPSRFTESAIAASVMFAALLNLYPMRWVRRWQAAFFFGLIHGFGFASAFQAMGVSGGGLVAAVLLFNLGVELGQLAVVAAVLPFAFALPNGARHGPRVFRVASSLIAVIGLLWFTERAFDLRFLPVH